MENDKHINNKVSAYIKQNFQNDIKKMETIKELKKICQPDLKEAWINRIMRNISPYITKFLLLLGLNANQVTFIILVLGIIGGLMFFFPKLWFIGIIFLFIAFILDHSDGEVARYRKTISLKGCYIGDIYHVIVPKIYFAGLTFSTYLLTNKLSVFIFGFLCIMFSTSISTRIYYYTLFDKNNHNLKEPNKVTIISFLWGNPYVLFILLFVLLLGFRYICIVFYGILFTIVQIGGFISRIRRLKYLERGKKHF